MPFIDRLTNEYTPERIYALCKLVYSRPSLSKDEVKELLQPAVVNKSQDLFDKIVVFAKRGQLIAEDVDGKITLALEGADVQNLNAFRNTLAKLVFSRPELRFCRFTGWYIGRGEHVLSEDSTTLKGQFDIEMNPLGEKNLYNETNIDAWKHWATFFGLGYHHPSKKPVLIPNAARRLSRVITSERWNTGKTVSFGHFMQWLSQTCPELDGGSLFNANRGKANLPEKSLSLALSSGLRALHDRGSIVLRYGADSTDTWFLYPVNSHAIVEKVSEIQIGGASQWT